MAHSDGYTRRTFLTLGTATVAGFAAGCGGSGSSSNPPATTRGTLTGSTRLASLTPQQVNAVAAQFGITGVPAARYGVDVYAITYTTIDTDGNATTASGRVSVPTGATGPLPLVSYQHGTRTLKSDVPSSANDLEGSGVSLLFSSGGYVVSMADYLGLGQSPGLHPYLHAASESSASMDMIRAARQASQNLTLPVSGKLFLAGHSQGGHATLALLRDLTQKATSEFAVTAAAPASGPYDLSGTTLTKALTNPGPEDGVFVAYVAQAYNRVYRLNLSASDLYVAPYDAQIPALFDGTKTIAQIQAALPARPTQFLQPALLAKLQSDPNSPLLAALRANDVYDFKPTAPVRLYYSKADEIVPYQNVIVASTRMTALGATVSTVSVGDTLTHAANLAPALIAARAWFDTLL